MKFIIDLLEKLKLNVVLQAQEMDKEFTWTQLFNPEFYIIKYTQLYGAFVNIL